MKLKKSQTMKRRKQQIDISISANDNYDLNFLVNGNDKHSKNSEWLSNTNMPGSVRHSYNSQITLKQNSPRVNQSLQSQITLKPADRKVRFQTGAHHAKSLSVTRLDKHKIQGISRNNKATKDHDESDDSILIKEEMQTLESAMNLLPTKANSPNIQSQVQSPNPMSLAVSPILKPYAASPNITLDQSLLNQTSTPQTQQKYISPFGVPNFEVQTSSLIQHQPLVFKFGGFGTKSKVTNNLSVAIQNNLMSKVQAKIDSQHEVTLQVPAQISPKNL
eukprot:403341449